MGHTYGGAGHLELEAARRRRDRTLAGPQIGPTWDEALDYPARRSAASGRALLRALPWRRLAPRPERVRLDPPADARGPAGRGASRRAGPGSSTCRRAGRRSRSRGWSRGGWRARWLDPRTGAEQAIGAAEPGLDLAWRAPGAPTAEDWVLVLEGG